MDRQDEIEKFAYEIHAAIHYSFEDLIHGYGVADSIDCYEVAERLIRRGYRRVENEVERQ